MRTLRLTASALVVLAVLACEKEPTLTIETRIEFKMVSGTCGGPINFQFSVDQVVVGNASLWDDQTSEQFVVVPGTRAVRTVIPGAMFVHDTTMTLASGQLGTVVLSPYCS